MQICKICDKTLLKRQKKYCSRKCMGEANTGENNPFYGKHHSEETKKKIRVASKGENNPFYGKHHSEETKKKIRVALKGKHLSDETKKKMSAANKGENNPMFGMTGEHSPNYGKHLSDETKKKMSVAKKGRMLSAEHKRKLSETRIKRGLSKGEKNPMFGKPPVYPRSKWRKKGLEVLGHPVRLSWEFKFAQFLQDNDITYSYEPKAFPMIIEGKKTTYTPDFYIPEQDNGGLWILPFPMGSYVEVKGYMREDAQKKIDYFRDHYHALVLLDRKEINKIIQL